MYKTILVPLDGSKRAEKILSHVEELAKCLGSDLVLLEVVSPVYYMIDPQMSFADIDTERTRWQVKEAEGYLENWQKKLERRKIKTRAMVEQGPVVEVIIEVAGRVNADLVAMASHGRSGLARVFYGSVAAGVLQRVDRPLLLIRSQEGE